MTKESKYTPENHRLIFRETFLSEQDVRRNGGVPDNLTFRHGCGVFVYDIAGSSTIEYEENANVGTPLLLGDLSVEMCIKPDSWGYGCGDSCRIVYNGELQVGLIGGASRHVFATSNGSDFTNSATDPFSLNEWVHILVTRASDGTINFYVNGELSGDADQDSGTPQAGDENFIINDPNFPYSGLIDYVTIYNSVLSSEEASNLYKGKRFRDLYTGTEIFDISAASGSLIDRWGNTLTNTATSVVKHTPGYVISLPEAVTVNIATGVSAIPITQDITLMGWIMKFGKGLIWRNGRIWDDGQIIIRHTISNNRLTVTCQNFGGAEHQPDNFFDNEDFKWVHVGITITAGGLASIYKNGELFGSANQDCGTRTLGGTLHIGSDAANQTIVANMNNMRLFYGILSDEEINQDFTESRVKFQV